MVCLHLYNSDLKHRKGLGQHTSRQALKKTLTLLILFIGHKLLAGGFLTYILSKELLILHDEVLMLAFVTYTMPGFE